MGLSDLLQIVVTFSVGFIFFFLIKKGVKINKNKFVWLRYVLATILFISFILYFIPDASKGYSAWDLSQRYNIGFAYLGLTLLCVAFVLFLLRSKVAYLIGICLYSIYFVFIVASMSSTTPLPRIFGPAILLYPIGMVLMLIFGLLRSSTLFKHGKNLFIARVENLTFEHFALCIPLFFLGIDLALLGFFLINSEEKLVAVCLLLFGLVCSIASAISLIPKKK